MFCQNYQISQQLQGTIYSPAELADAMIELENSHATNINLVTPTPHLPGIVSAIAIAVEHGLNIPIVMNTNGYNRPKIIDLLNGIIDIYLPDFKYGSNVWAEKFSRMHDYIEICQQSIRKMANQTGKLTLDGSGCAYSGTIVRHLILPHGYSGSLNVFRLIAEIDPSIPTSIMAQYQPRYNALDFKEINRPITKQEFITVMEHAKDAGLTDIYFQKPQDLPEDDPFFPDFHLTNDQVFGQKSYLP